MKNLTLLSFSLLTLVACGKAVLDPADPVDGSTNGLVEQSTCAAAGGTCVAITPTSCASGDWGDPGTCGSGVGVGCCLGSEPEPQPEPQSACVVSGGTCVGLGPTSCASGTWGDPTTCGGSVGVGCCLPSEPTECTPITLAPGNPAAMYCAGLGYQLDGSACAFPDGTSCDQWAFFRGECGQARSFCNLHGGTVTSETRDFGEWTAVLAVCTLPAGKKCDETLYAGSCVCE